MRKTLYPDSHKRPSLHQRYLIFTFVRPYIHTFILAPMHFDVLIIGAGVGGGAVALALAPTGKRIGLLDRGHETPRERENWDADRVFGPEQRYATDERWTDGHTGDELPRVDVLRAGRQHQGLRLGAAPPARGRLRRDGAPRRRRAGLAHRLRRSRAVLRPGRAALPRPRPARQRPVRARRERPVSARRHPARPQHRRRRRRPARGRPPADEPPDGRQDDRGPPRQRPVRAPRDVRPVRPRRLRRLSRPVPPEGRRRGRHRQAGHGLPQRRAHHRLPRAPPRGRWAHRHGR